MEIHFMLLTYVEVQNLATGYVAEVHKRYRIADTDEAPYALDTLEAIARANKLNGTRSELQVGGVAWAHLELDGTGSGWVPRPEMLGVDDKDDINVLAEITAYRVTRDFEPISHLKEYGPLDDMFESGELVGNVVIADDSPVADAICARTRELIDQLHGSTGGLWQPKLEPEFPFDAEPPHDENTESRKDEDHRPF
jgi:hypothetical protein